MTHRRTVRLVQLPIPQMARFAPSGNVPLAAGCLALAARAAGVPGVAVEMVGTETTDLLGDSALADALAAGEPAAVAFSLYLWNHERSLHVAREVKRRSPRTKIVIGGPEVAPDNEYLLAASGFDIAVTGEAESVFPAVLERIAMDRCAGGLPGVAVRGKNGLSPFAPVVPPDFALSKYPSPYLADLIGVDPNAATYVETVRGCRSHCTFCFYPRSSAVLRALDVAASRDLVAALAMRGAREIVFLDPTFNHRPGFDEMLTALADVHRATGVRFFGEVRAEGLTEAHADGLAAAGFYKLEIGLQSVNPIALAKTKRGGNKDLVAKAAKMLEARGIDLLLDLIVGLPGDEREHVVAGIDFLAAQGLSRYAQVFPLQILPGTAMRANAAQDGLEFDRRPPYRIQRTPTLDADAIEELLGYAEERLDRRLDETPRPFLCDGDSKAAVPDVFTVDADAPLDLAAVSRPGTAHAALWITGNDLWAKRQSIAAAIEARLRVDPFAILDVVLAPHRAFPLDLLTFVRAAFTTEPQGYASRSGLFPTDERGRRVSIVLRRGVEFARDWVDAVRGEAPTFRESTADEAFALGSRLDADEPGARIVDRGRAPTDPVLRGIEVLADPNAVTFADRATERAFVERQVLA